MTEGTLGEGRPAHLDDLELARSLVREAGDLAARMRDEGLEAQHKSGIADVVTAADREAEALVVARLRSDRPEDGILGEEGAQQAGASGRTWVIDPVDGTYNFFRGLDWWCSALALVGADGEPLVGAVHHPATGRTYVGGPDGGVLRGTEPLAPVDDVPLRMACVATYLHPPLYTSEVGAAFADAIAGAATLRMLGSASMDAAAIAEGRCDVLVQHSVPDWDRLPGAALIRGVGGESRQVDAAGVRWHVTGVPTAVAEICAVLADR